MIYAIAVVSILLNYRIAKPPAWATNSDRWFCYASFYFLFQRIEFRCIEKLSQSNSKAIANHLDCQQLGILAFSIKDILNTGRRQCGYRCQLIDTDFMLTAECQYNKYTVLKIIQPVQYNSSILFPVSFWCHSVDFLKLCRKIGCAGKATRGSDLIHFLIGQQNHFRCPIHPEL